MSPAPRTDPQEEQSLNQDQNAVSVLIRVSGDHEDRRCFLHGKDTRVPKVIPPALNTSHSSLSRCTASSLPATHTACTNPRKTLLAHAENRKGDEESGAEGRQGEEEGRRKKGTSYNPVMTRRVRDLAAFWLLGFCNNFTYWVMITAAYDLLAVQTQGYEERSSTAATPRHSLNVSFEVTVQLPKWNNDSFVNTFTCNRHSTGAILVADTLPATTLTLMGPFTLLLGVGVRVWLLSALCIASYLVLGLASPGLVFLGVALASASRGISDATFLGHASSYHKNVLSLWSSGTGVATFVGPLLFSAMTTFGLHPRHALLSFLAVPLLILFSFWCVLTRAQPLKRPADLDKVDSAALVCEEEMEGKRQKMTAVIKEKLFLIGRTQKYLLPMEVFYLIMYTTNQGLLEMVYFPASHLSHAQQYSWSMTIRCLGTLISRSSHKLLLLPSMWLYSIFALVIMAVVGTEVQYHYLPSEYIIFALLLAQGLAEGATFRAAVFTLHKKTSEEDRKFCLTIFPAFLFLPAMLAGFVSIPTHDFLCHHHPYRQ